MEFYREYFVWFIFLCCIYVVVVGVLVLFFMFFWKDCVCFYSYLYCVWLKISDKLVWMDQVEKVIGDFY